jgi:hypothetical protein
MTVPQGCVPTFQANLRHDTGPQPYIVSVSIIHLIWQAFEASFADWPESRR